MREKVPPTDLEILSEIYDYYYDAFTVYTEEEPKRESKIYVPVDVDMIAKRLAVDGDIVFGRLYYHLNKKFGYQKAEGSSVHVFALQVGEDRHCVNFPLLASILANLQKENRQFRMPLYVSFGSLLVSIIAVIVASGGC